jgi:hypothetical protein
MDEPRSAQRYLEDLTPGGSEYFDNPKRCYETVVTRLESAHRIALNAALERNRQHERADALQAEVERLRAVLREIARTATQSVDTAFGGRLCHQIEQMARAALAE